MEMQPGQMAYDRASTVFSPDRPPLPGRVHAASDPDGWHRRRGHLRRGDRLRGVPKPPRELARGVRIDREELRDRPGPRVRDRGPDRRLAGPRRVPPDGGPAPPDHLRRGRALHAARPCPRHAPPAVHPVRRHPPVRRLAPARRLLEAMDVPGLIELDPSGATIGWKAYAIGRNRRAVADFLEEKIGTVPDRGDRVQARRPGGGRGLPDPVPRRGARRRRSSSRRRTSAGSRPPRSPERVPGLPFIGAAERANRPAKCATWRRPVAGDPQPGSAASESSRRPDPPSGAVVRDREAVRLVPDRPQEEHRRHVRVRRSERPRLGHVELLHALREADRRGSAPRGCSSVSASRAASSWPSSAVDEE